MTERHIVAMGGGQGPDGPDLSVPVRAGGRAKPKVLYVPTATGDNDRGGARRSTGSFPAHSFEPSDLGAVRADGRGPARVRAGPGRGAGAGRQHREHAGHLARARAGRGPARGWEAGVVMAGGSAGANCWFEASTTDSFLMGSADPLADGLGFVAGSFCPTTTREPVTAAELTGGWSPTATLPPGHRVRRPRRRAFRGTEIAEVVVSDADAGRVARRARRSTAAPLRTPLAVRRLERVHDRRSAPGSRWTTWSPSPTGRRSPSPSSARARVDGRARGGRSERWRRAPTIYGVTTGFGALADTRIDPAQAAELQHGIIRSHATAVGDAAVPRGGARHAAAACARPGARAFGRAGRGHRPHGRRCSTRT